MDEEVELPLDAVPMEEPDLPDTYYSPFAYPDHEIERSY